jgi:hypothetical protein
LTPPQQRPLHLSLLVEEVYDLSHDLALLYVPVEPFILRYYFFLVEFIRTHPTPAIVELFDKFSPNYALY